MTRKAITAEGASTAGPYSHAIESNGFVFLSGQTPSDPKTKTLINGNIKSQTQQCFDNLNNVLKAAGLSFEDVVKVNVFLTNMADFADMNSVYAEQFKQPYPARSTIGVAALPLGAQVEIELIAQVK